MFTTVTPGVDRWPDFQGTLIRLNLPYKPFARQRAFHGSPAKYRLFGGAAGPGKSKALLMECVVRAFENPGANTLLLRRTFPELEQTLLHYFRRDVPRNLYTSFQESKHLVTWMNGATTRFGYCQREADVYQYQGGEYVFIGIDELTLFTLRQWQFLTSRNRCPVARSFPNMAGATNPGNIGHAWVKALWVDKQPAPGMEGPDQYDPKDYYFVPARVEDNPIYAADENYLKTLRSLPSHLRRAFLDGDWNVFAGQYFDRFDPSVHVVRPEEIEWKAWWPRWISVDWGFEHPAAAYWHTSAPAAALRTEVRRSEPDPVRSTSRDADSAAAGRKMVPCAVTYREFLTRHTPPRELAHEIVGRSVAQDGTGEKVDAIYLSPDAFARRTDEASIAEQMGDVFAAAGFPRPIPADDDRVGGWMLMYQKMVAGEWLLTENCTELIRTLPTLVRDPARVEDVEKMDGDDPADAARYGLKSRFGARQSSAERMPYEDRLAMRITSTDPTIRAIQAHKALVEESRLVKPVSFLRRRK
ncbi:MAG TPA: phage terminase large subunit [Candidatus Limnocylindrales bacterium]|nr:phage terminase large subunit [Candidatus Limnocylindrales bacterium]